jgi:Fur family ferric uptake transcriptional regulator
VPTDWAEGGRGPYSQDLLTESIQGGIHRLDWCDSVAIAVSTMDEFFGQFRSFLHGQSRRATGIREEIIGAAMACRGHFDVDDLVQKLRKRGSGVSRASVYRALPLLVEAGIVEPTVSPGDRQRYEIRGAREHHDHLVCDECGTVVEFQFEAFEVLQREVAAKYGFSLTGHSHQLFGTCPKCQKKKGAFGKRRGSGATAHRSQLEPTRSGARMS